MDLAPWCCKVDEWDGWTSDREKDNFCVRERRKQVMQEIKLKKKKNNLGFAAD